MDPMDDMQALESRAFWRLGQFLVLRQCHVSRKQVSKRHITTAEMYNSRDGRNSPSQLNQNGFHGVVPLPLGKAGELGWVHLVIIHSAIFPS